MEQYSHLPGATRIGTIWLYIPPSQFTITEQNSNVAFDALRMPGQPRIKTSEQERRIEMSVIFPNMWSINYQFRPILAQFIRSPILPIQNKDMENSLLSSYMTTLTSPREQAMNDRNGTGSQKQKAKYAKMVADKKAGKPAKKVPVEGTNEDRAVGSSLTEITQKSTDLEPFWPAHSYHVYNRELYVILRNLTVTTVPGTPESLQANFVYDRL